MKKPHTIKEANIRKEKQFRFDMEDYRKRLEDGQIFSAKEFMNEFNIPRHVPTAPIFSVETLPEKSPGKEKTPKILFKQKTTEEIKNHFKKTNADFLNSLFTDNELSTLEQKVGIEGIGRILQYLRSGEITVGFLTKETKEKIAVALYKLECSRPESENPTKKRRAKKQNLNNVEFLKPQTPSYSDFLNEKKKRK